MDEVEHAIAEEPRWSPRQYRRRGRRAISKPMKGGIGDEADAPVHAPARPRGGSPESPMSTSSIEQEPAGAAVLACAPYTERDHLAVLFGRGRRRAARGAGTDQENPRGGPPKRTARHVGTRRRCPSSTSARSNARSPPSCRGGLTRRELAVDQTPVECGAVAADHDRRRADSRGMDASWWSLSLHSKGGAPRALRLARRRTV